MTNQKIGIYMFMKNEGGHHVSFEGVYKEG